VDRLFEDFYRAEYENVYRAAFATCRDGNMALDATQEAFSQAYARWSRLARESWAGGWVTTTALNACKRQMRKDRWNPTARPVTEHDKTTIVSDRLQVLDALRNLPFRQQQAVLLRYYADQPIAVVAQLMNLSEGAVKTHLSRARETLRDQLQSADV
jgi:RNA polymerase sigma-70 factor (ECF subfamily)